LGNWAFLRISIERNQLFKKVKGAKEKVKEIVEKFASGSSWTQ